MELSLLVKLFSTLNIISGRLGGTRRNLIFTRSLSIYTMLYYLIFSPENSWLPYFAIDFLLLAENILFHHHELVVPKQKITLAPHQCI